jgi:hypothetical protein
VFHRPLSLVKVLVLALGFLAPLFSNFANSHLLNMTEAALSVDREGFVSINLNIDLSRSMDTSEAYFDLATNLQQSSNLAIWSSIGDAIMVENAGQRVPLIFIEAGSEKSYILKDFLDPLTWPKLRLTFKSLEPLKPEDFALDVTFTSGFFFEEPISLALSVENHQTRMGRWLVTNQRSPILKNGDEAITENKPPILADQISMLREGVMHVVPKGVDHLLFLLGLSWWIVGVRKLVAVVSLFTLAHCISLLAASYRLIEVNSLLVELGILGTITWLGLRVLQRRRLSDTEYQQASTIDTLGYGIIFLFGLIHGLGFSTAFLALDIYDNIIIQLLAFNIGVEFAQIMCVTTFATVFIRLKGSTNLSSVTSFVLGWLLVTAPMVSAWFLVANIS